MERRHMRRGQGRRGQDHPRVPQNNRNYRPAGQPVRRDRQNSTSLEQSRFDNIYFHPQRRFPTLLTPNLTPKLRFFDENFVRRGGVEYREWDPRRSKLAAAIKNHISQIRIREGSVVLYLGASHGYTPSYVSDIVGKEGFVYCLEVAPQVATHLVTICDVRSNMTALLEDAFHPERYAGRVTLVDVVYQDIAQRNQVEIFLKNCAAFLKKGGFGLLALKARSVDVTKRPQAVFNQALNELERHMTIVDKRELSPHEKDHMLIVCKKQ